MILKKFYLFLFLFVSTALFAQKQITGQLKPKGDYKTILMYKTEGAFQYYKASAKVDENGLFGFKLPENFQKGSYKLVYEAQKDLAVNIIYNNKDISLAFNPEDVINSIFFYESENNTLLYDYVKTISTEYDELNTIQKKYYIDNSKELARKYNSKLAKIKVYQNYFDKQAKGKIAQHFIRAFPKPISETPLNSLVEKLDFLKKNYLNNINFQDSTLRNSALLIDRLNEYIFDLNEAMAKKKNQAIDLNMVDVALSKIADSKFKNEVVYSLTSSAFDPYSSTYDNLLDHLFRNYYTKLAEEAKNKKFTLMVQAKLNAIVGKKAPNINFEDSSLYAIQSDSILIIFWSTTCSHCLKEIPKVYEEFANSKNLKVVMVGLEDEYSDWINVSLTFPKWIQKRANGKWKNPIAIAYNIKGTPAYFLLDKNKKIIAKPNKLEDLEKVLGKK
jgi:thiol-disulfide isomerase/thioredoxin